MNLLFRNAMYKPIALILLILLPFFSESQERAFLRTGAGIPLFTKPYFPTDWEPERYSGFPRYTLFAEIPNVLPGTMHYNFSLNPGIHFFYMEQHEGPGTGLGAGSELELKRYSLSVYLKFLYHFSSDETTKHRWYAGTVAGVQVARKSEGDYSWWMKQSEGYSTGGESITDENDRFFNPFYVGYLVGVSSGNNHLKFLKPALELSYYPDFIINRNKTMGSHSRRGRLGMAVVSVVFEIGK